MIFSRRKKPVTKHLERLYDLAETKEPKEHVISMSILEEAEHALEAGDHRLAASFMEKAAKRMANGEEKMPY